LEEARRLAVEPASRNLAEQVRPCHGSAMRKLALSTVLIVAACAPRQVVAPPVTVAQPPPQAAQRNDLIGLTAPQLIGIFGSPALQVREGPSLKMQFRSRSCILDAYLYPEPTQERVSYVEARLPSGDPANAQSCYDTLKR
jgi:hypothetical protein